jgi:diaminohydroxyphosphoribosylaminopyrimidine deaminase/5-amino-6-(5-phosphoribosylamino)uracil reductase
MNSAIEHTDFMRRCLQLASLAENQVAPNPMVGAVIRLENKIIAEGYHQSFGGAHAEVNALNQIYDKAILEKSILYVSLEPCCHFGKTPPCTDLIIHKNISNVWISTVDPNPLVKGEGIKKLKASGINVTIGLLENEAKELNKRFFTFHEKNRPYIILKWAETADGFIADKDYNSKWISSFETRVLVHKWRSEEMAILVGTATAIYDNPQLNVRLWKGKNPIRCLLDLNLQVTPNYKLFNDDSSVIIFNLIKEQQSECGLKQWVKVKKNAVVEDILYFLKQKNITSLFVEGGAKTHQMFLSSGFVDEIRRIVSKKKFFKEGVKAPRIPSKFYLKEMLELEDDYIQFYRRND